MYSNEAKDKGSGQNFALFLPMAALCTRNDDGWQTQNIEGL